MSAQFKSTYFSIRAKGTSALSAFGIARIATRIRSNHVETMRKLDMALKRITYG